MKYSIVLFSAFFISAMACCQTPELVLPVGHTTRAQLISYSPDGKLMSTNTGTKNDYGVKVWEAATGKLLHDYPFFNATPKHLAFVNDGKYFLTHDFLLRLWDLQSNKQVSYFDSLPAEKISISPDKKMVAIQPALGFQYIDSIVVFSLETGKEVNRFVCEGNETAADDIVFHPDGKSILTFHKNYNLKTKASDDVPDTSRFVLWDIAAGKKIWEKNFEEGNKVYGKLQFTSSGNYIIGEYENEIFDGKSGTQVSFKDFTPEGYLDTLAAATADSAAKELNKNKGTTLEMLATPDATNTVKGIAAYISESSVHVLSIDKRDTLLLIPTSNYAEVPFRCSFSSNGNYLSLAFPGTDTATNDNYQNEVWDIAAKKKIGILPFNIGPDILELPDNKKLAIVSPYGTISIRDKNNFKETALLRGHTKEIQQLTFSKDGKNVFIIDEDGLLRMQELATGKLLYSKKDLYEIAKYSLVRNNSYKLLLTKNDKAVYLAPDSVVAVFNVNSGSILYTIKPELEIITDIALHPSDSFFVLTESMEYAEGINTEGLIKHIDMATGKVLKRFKLKNDGVYISCSITPNGKYMAFQYGENIEIRNTQTNLVIKKIPGKVFSNFSFSPDSKLLAVAKDSIAHVWDVASGTKISTFKTSFPQYFKRLYPGSGWILPDVSFITFSPDSKSILAGASYTGISYVFTALTGKLNFLLDSVSASKPEAGWFIENGKTIATQEKDNNLLFWDAATGRYLGNISNPGQGISAAAVNEQGSNVTVAFGASLYTFNNWRKAPNYQSVLVNDKDWLIIDSLSRYDGSEAARKLLYFVCGNETIDLAQVKDRLWVPGLAERLTKGETIHTKGINELNICGLTPVVEDKTKDKAFYRFEVTPRKGGLGDVVVTVNGIEVKRTKLAELEKTGNAYVLNLPAASIKEYFMYGNENKVTVKALTADNTIASRGLDVDEDSATVNRTPPNLYAVMVGVSDYKGDDLDLKYAAKDATDIGSTIENAAKKLLNNDKQEHVFVYNLTTGEKRYQLPEKTAIKKLLEEIGVKATPNDILLLFFAGHGVMQQGKDAQNQFYFLTAEASSLSAGSAVGDVGISTAELAEWMKPHNIKAQKRILIFDACNSGQAINDFVKMGNNQDYVVARNDEAAQQIKAIDKLNEKSGLFILSASASNQSAYELGRYSQGLLTYSLLKAIKEQPDILADGKYLDVSRWFGAAEKTVGELAKETGARQQPQLVSNTNFNVGMVDEEVIAKISLPDEKPLFTASNFQNSDEAIADDDLELNRSINLSLASIAARNINKGILYVTATNSPTAYTLSGRYTVKGNVVTVTANLKQHKQVKQRFEITGTKDKIEELAAAITNKALELVK